MKRLAYLTLVVELIIWGIAFYESFVPGCGGLVGDANVTTMFSCGPTIVTFELVGPILIAITLAYIIVLHLKARRVPVSRPIFSATERAGLMICVLAIGAFLLASEWPAKWTKFPEISNWNSLKITLQRDGCFGECPVYKVEIHGDGTVIYDGKQFVAVKGHQEGRIPVETVRALFEQFRKTDFFALSSYYEMVGFDASTHTISIAFDGRSKSVREFAGADVGMPYSVTELQNAIDRAANTEKWIKDTDSGGAH